MITITNTNTHTPITDLLKNLLTEKLSQRLDRLDKRSSTQFEDISLTSKAFETFTKDLEQCSIQSLSLEATMINVNELNLNTKSRNTVANLELNGGTSTTTGNRTLKSNKTTGNLLSTNGKLNSTRGTDKSLPKAKNDNYNTNEDTKPKRNIFIHNNIYLYSTIF
jgi:hypothetical protein